MVTEVEKKNIIKWVETHKKQLIMSGISVSAFVAFILGVKNIDTLMELWGVIQEEIKKGTKYSARWFKNIADAELMAEREIVRLEYCASGTDSSKALRLESLLSLFDVEKSRRDWGKKTPHVTNIPREHGKYLMNDE